MRPAWQRFRSIMAVVEAEISKPAAPPARRKVTALDVLAMLALLSSAGASGLALIARYWVWSEIATHFLVYYAIASLVAAVLFAVARRPKFAFAAGLLFFWQASGIAPWYVPAAKAASGRGPHLKLMTANVNADNQHYDKLIALVRAENPDLLFVQEMSYGWAEALRALDDAYPYRSVTPRHDYWGIALYSKYPLENIVADSPVEPEAPQIRADAIIDGRRVHLMNVHLAPPRAEWMVDLRYKHYAWAEQYLSKMKDQGPLIIAGDFNSSPWSPLYADLVRTGGLTNARQGYGLLPSWYPLAGRWFLIPLDQICGAGGVSFSGIHLGSVIDSDHIPVITEITLAQ